MHAEELGQRGATRRDGPALRLRKVHVEALRDGRAVRDARHEEGAYARVGEAGLAERREGRGDDLGGEVQPAACARDERVAPRGGQRKARVTAEQEVPKEQPQNAELVDEVLLEVPGNFF